MLEAVFGGIASFLLKLAPKVLSSVVRALTDELQSATKPGWLPKGIAAGIDGIIAKIKAIDQEISGRERAGARSDSAMSAEQEHIAELQKQKQEHFRNLEQAKKNKAADQLARQPDEFTQTPLDDNQTHLLQYHLGLLVLEKRCPKCRYPMKLQHQNMDDPSFANFFWQCTRFYTGEKCSTVQFRATDIKLLHEKDVPELEISKADLLTIGSEKAIQTDTIARMKDHLGTEDSDILCPAHSVPMMLREKQEGTRLPLLERYHLRCPHFRCTQTEKLKSVPQLAAFLRRKEGIGIIH